MAIPIKLGTALEVNEEENRAVKLETLLTVIADQAEGIEEWMHLLRLLHEHGFLGTGIAAIAEGEALLQMVMEQLNQPGPVKGMQNILSIVQSLATVDVDKVAPLVQGLQAGFEFAATENRFAIRGVLDIVKLLRDPDVATAVSVLFTMLKGFGQFMRSSASSLGGNGCEP